MQKLFIPVYGKLLYLLKMPVLAKWVNNDLLKVFSAPQVAQKHDWPETMVWSRALVNKDDFRLIIIVKLYIHPVFLNLVPGFGQNVLCK